MKGQGVMHSRAATGGKDNWRTPPWLVMGLAKLFRLTGDAAADGSNFLFRRYLGPGSPLGEDALAVTWDARLRAGTPYFDLWWLNPPYSQADAFIRKAHEEAVEDRAATILLVGARTDTKWYHELVLWPEARAKQRVVAHFVPIQSRLRFLLPDGTIQQQPAPFPSALLGFFPVERHDLLRGWQMRDLRVHGTTGITIRESDGRWASRWREVIAVPGRRERKAV